MRREVIILALLGAIVFAGQAWAQDDGEREWAAFNDYLEATSNSFLTGLNGLVTGPADPVMSAVDPLAEYSELPLSSVTGRFIGFFQGALLGAYRIGTGVADMVFAPLPFVTMSPEPRYTLLPGFEYEEY